MCNLDGDPLSRQTVPACDNVRLMVAFICNICARKNQVEHFASEPATCSCGSNVRLRALLHLLSLELFGHSIPVCDFPRLKAVRGLGMTDNTCYARILEDRFDYTNTYYDREPRLDFREAHPDRVSSYDFILSADVLEHIAPPIELALSEVHSLLKPQGFFGVTVPCQINGQFREHFPELHEYRTVPLAGREVLINRRRDGTLEVFDDLVIHGGTGEILEMRAFGVSALEAKLRSVGFRAAYFLTSDVPEWGIIFDHDTSQPFIARKQPFVLDRCAQHQLFEVWNNASCEAWDARERSERIAAQLHLAAQSRWFRFGRRLGLGPRFEE
jgi:SAM-dependent methyltransferase